MLYCYLNKINLILFYYRYTSWVKTDFYLSTGLNYYNKKIALEWLEAYGDFARGHSLPTNWIYDHCRGILAKLK